MARSPRSSKIKVLLSPTPKKASGVIYRFKHVESGKKYVGSVAETARGNNTGRRISRYHSEFNLKGISKKGRPISRAIRLDPEAFTFGIYEQLPSGTSESELHKAENRWQERYDTRSVSGYNTSDPRTEPLRTKPLFDSSNDSEEPSKSE